jgi:hypothetical protein
VLAKRGTRASAAARLDSWVASHSCPASRSDERRARWSRTTTTHGWVNLSPALGRPSIATVQASLTRSTLIKSLPILSGGEEAVEVLQLPPGGGCSGDDPGPTTTRLVGNAELQERGYDGRFRGSCGALIWLPSLGSDVKSVVSARSWRGVGWVVGRVASLVRVRAVADPKCRRAGSGRPRWM